MWCKYCKECDYWNDYEEVCIEYGCNADIYCEEVKEEEKAAESDT